MKQSKNLVPTTLDIRVSLLEQFTGHINQSLLQLDQRIEQNAKEFREEMKEFRQEVKSDFRWVFGLIVTLNSGLLGVMARGFHWM